DDAAEPATTPAEAAPADDASDAPAETGTAEEPASPTAEASDATTESTPSVGSEVPGLSEHAATIAAGYAFEGGVLPLGALIEDGEPVPQAQIGLPLAMMNRHGLVAGATGTGKTRTLQGMAERSEEHTSELQSRENLVCR